MLYDQVSNDIKEAMKARDKVRLETLRNIKKVFIEAKTAPGANDTLEDAAALKILAKLAKQGKESADTFIAQNRQDLADEELAQVKVIEEYLPKPLSADEIEGIYQFLDHTPEDCLKIFDINLRQNFYTPEVITESLKRCNVLKIG